MSDNFEIEYQRILVTMSLLQHIEDSDYTEKHSLRVGRLVKDMCEEMGFNLTKINLVTRSAYFHDVGKIKLSKIVLFKVGSLTDDEFEEMKLHPIYSRDILISLGLPEEAQIAVNHHEKLDGSGYPFGLKNDEIGIETRILTVADVFDAITADRPYRKGVSIKDALLFLYSKANKHYDLEIIKLLHRVLENNKKLKKII